MEEKRPTSRHIVVKFQKPVIENHASFQKGEWRSPSHLQRLQTSQQQNQKQENKEPVSLKSLKENYFQP